MELYKHSDSLLNSDHLSRLNSKGIRIKIKGNIDYKVHFQITYKVRDRFPTKDLF